MSQIVSDEPVDLVMNGATSEKVNNMAVEVDVDVHERDRVNTQTQINTEPETPMNKKRSLSQYETSDSESEPSPVSKRTKTDQSFTEGAPDEQIDNTTIYKMFQSLSVQMSGLSGLYTDLRDRISNIETNIETKLTQKFKSAIDTRFEVEMSEIRAEVTAEIAVVRSEVNNRYDDMEKTYAAAVECNLIQRDDSPNVTNAVVIKMLPERANEDTNPNITTNCVNALLKDGLQLRASDARVVTADRKQNKGRRGNPGAVVVTFETRQQKERVMKEKRKLRGSDRYSKVYIEDTMSNDEIKADQNLKTIIRELGLDYYVKKGRMVKRTGHGGGRDRRGSGGTGTERSVRNNDRNSDSRIQTRGEDQGRASRLNSDNRSNSRGHQGFRSQRGAGRGGRRGR